MTVICWLCNEMSFVSDVVYKNPFEDVDLDVVFVTEGKTITFPAFYDGDNVFRVRFSLPKCGIWKYTLVCSDSENRSLKGYGEVICVPYDGDLPIYRHGFLKTTPNLRYFTYADGEPFFYLGDTHWNFLEEEFDTPGDHAGEINCSSHFKYIVDKRAEMGFNVYQSEPIGAKYSLSDGLFEGDIPAFRELDRRFAYIAEKGFVHANAQILFPSLLIKLNRINDKEYLKRLGRYWAARYGAYPVLWTLGQEVDNDFYYTRGDQKHFTKENHPYHYIAEGLHQADPHKQPLTAHMEFYRVELRCGKLDGTLPSNSSFRNVPGHSFYAYQWSRKLNLPIDYTFAKDGWLNGQGKVLILYESSYENLWTKNFGARSQGWIAYLNGLYGYGYGCVDIWLYKSAYDMENPTSDGIEIVTPADKSDHWCRSVEYKTATELKYMRDFFEKLQWWKLVPRFDSELFFISDSDYFYSLASDERNTFVIYFFNQGKTETGRLTNLDNSEYAYQWFDPRSGKYKKEERFTPNENLEYHLEAKPDENDWVLLIKKA